MSKDIKNEVSTLNVTLQEAGEIIESCLLSDDTFNIMLLSSPGVGKSSKIKQIVQKIDHQLIDISLSEREASEVGGFAYIDEGIQRFSTPHWFPKDTKKPGVLLLEELLNCPMSVQHAAYRLLWDHEISSGKKLPSNWSVLAASNLMSDKCGVRVASEALNNRFSMHLKVRIDLDSTLKYFINIGLDSKIIGFLKMHPDFLHKMPEGLNKVNSAAWPSPRTWEEINKILKLPIKSHMKNISIASCVGDEAAYLFQDFIENWSRLPNYELMLSDSKYKYDLDHDAPGLMIALTTSLVQLFMANSENNSNIQKLDKFLQTFPKENKMVFFKFMSMIEDKVKVINIYSSMDLAKHEEVLKYIKGSPLSSS